MKLFDPDWLLGAVIAVAASTAQAADPRAPDQDFFDKAAIAGLYEVKAGALARRHGGSERVRNYAGMMVNDHGNANQKLQALAGSKGVTLPGKLDAAHQKKLDKLARAGTGKAFDEEFADQMEASHDQALKLFEKALKKAKDLDVRAFAAATLPTLRIHSAMAEALDRKDVSP